MSTVSSSQSLTMTSPGSGKRMWRLEKKTPVTRGQTQPQLGSRDDDWRLHKKRRSPASESAGSLRNGLFNSLLFHSTNDCNMNIAIHWLIRDHELK